MTNTKFRKRALLSSVAMLLVALVALGSATFAWFVANPTANAAGLSLKTTAEAGVFVASETKLAIKTAKSTDETWLSAYGSSTVLNATGDTMASAVTNSVAKDLQPVSPNTSAANFTDGALSFGKIAASAATTEAADTSKKFEDAISSDFYTEKVYLKASTDDDTASATVKSVSTTIQLVQNAPAIASGVKVAITTSSGELVGIWYATGGQTTTTWNGDKTHNFATSGDNATVATYSGYKASGAWKDLTQDITVNKTINSSTGAASNYLVAYIYLDGQNSAVKSENVPSVTQLVSSIDISVSINDMEA